MLYFFAVFEQNTFFFDHVDLMQGIPGAHHPSPDGGGQGVHHGRQPAQAVRSGI